MKILETKQLKKYYGSDDTLVKALEGIDLSVEQGEFVSLWEHPAAGNQRFCICLEGWIVLHPV